MLHVFHPSLFFIEIFSSPPQKNLYFMEEGKKNKKHLTHVNLFLPFTKIVKIIIILS